MPNDGRCDAPEAAIVLRLKATGVVKQHQHDHLRLTGDKVLH